MVLNLIVNSPIMSKDKISSTRKRSVKGMGIHQRDIAFCFLAGVDQYYSAGLRTKRIQRRIFIESLSRFLHPPLSLRIKIGYTPPITMAKSSQNVLIQFMLSVPIAGHFDHTINNSIGRHISDSNKHSAHVSLLSLFSFYPFLLVSQAITYLSDCASLQSIRNRQREWWRISSVALAMQPGLLTKLPSNSRPRVNGLPLFYHPGIMLLGSTHSRKEKYLSIPSCF